ncbi:MAG: hypothetical protein LBI74_10450, partial [Synergistaceae bacterium]|nr:hypothetical protein [Synergistaceae bacterium]
RTRLSTSRSYMRPVTSHTPEQAASTYRRDISPKARRLWTLSAIRAKLKELWGIGTEATQESIISTLFDRGYIQLKSSKFSH